LAVRTGVDRLFVFGILAFSLLAPAQAASPQASATTTKPKADGPRQAPPLEYLGTLRAETGSRTTLENGPQGTRVVVPLVSGRFEGPRLKASLQAPAADWVTVRADGSAKFDVRFTLKTDDGANILVTYNGIGQTTGAGITLRSAPLFETGDARYTWLTHVQALAVGRSVGTTITYDMYFVP
jgi:hypothetical protein